MSWQGIDFTKFGGVGTRVPALAAAADPTDPVNQRWNFGALPGLEPLEVATVAEAAPHLAGGWDGTSRVSLWETTRKVLGHYLPAQYQVEGTCVGRGASGAVNVLQCVLMAAGQPIEYKPASHAWFYAGDRTLSGGLNWGIGAYGPNALLWGRQKGVVHRQESGDENDYGAGSDDKAVQWGFHGIPAGVVALGADNPLKEVAKCTSAEQAAAVIAAGGVVTITTHRFGFTMTRDAEGVCRPYGQWDHQMYLAAVMTTPSGRKVFGCGQSWGKNVPNGPLLPGCPDYVFGIEWSVLDALVKEGYSMAVTGFAGWTGPAGTDWLF